MLRLCNFKMPNRELFYFLKIDVRESKICSQLWYYIGWDELVLLCDAKRGKKLY